MNLLLTFTDNVSLQDWNRTGMIYREISLYNNLQKKNIAVWFLTYGNEGDLKFSRLLNGINIIPCFNLVKSKIPGLTFIKSLFLPIKLRNFFRKADILKTNQLNGSWVAWIGKLLFKKILIVRGGYDWLISHIILSKPKGFIGNMKYFFSYFRIYLYELIAYKLADGIILTSELDISFIIKCFKLKKKYKKHKIIQLYNYIDESLFKPLKIPKKDKYILFVGRLNEQKNLHNLFYAFKKLPGYRLDIIGTGPLKDTLKKEADHLGINVNFLGLFPNNRMPEIINQYKIFILPSYWEGNPKVLLEAMSCGVACIGTKVWGIKNIINHRENGYLCGTSSNSIKRAIVTLYNNQSLREKIGKNARTFILEHCSLNSITNKEYEFYNELLNRKYGLNFLHKI